jgi:hypothetical protein
MRFKLSLSDREQRHLNFSPNFMDITCDLCYINLKRSYIIITFRNLNKPVPSYCKSVNNVTLYNSYVTIADLSQITFELY